MNEMQSWGLTGAQTAVLFIGIFIILGAWVFLKNMVEIAKSAVLGILALLMACIFFATVVFYLVNNA